MGRPKTQFRCLKLRFWLFATLQTAKGLWKAKRNFVLFKATKKNAPLKGRRQAKTQFRARKLRFCPPQGLFTLNLTPTTLIPNPKLGQAKNAISVPEIAFLPFGGSHRAKNAISGTEIAFLASPSPGTLEPLTLIRNPNNPHPSPWTLALNPAFNPNP